MKKLHVAVAKNREYIKLDWETKDGYWKQVKIPIVEYYETKLK